MGDPDDTQPRSATTERRDREKMVFTGKLTENGERDTDGRGVILVLDRDIGKDDYWAKV